MHVDSGSFDGFADLVHGLQDEGLVIYAPMGAKKRGWDLVVRSKYRIGTLQSDRKGAGYVRPRGDLDGDLYVSPAKMRDAFSGDRVLVRITSEARGDRLREARVVDVLRRSSRPVRGVYRRAKGGAFLKPDDPRTPCDIFIPLSSSSRSVRDGETVIVRLEESTGGSFPEGKVIAELGDGDSYESDLATVMAEFELFGEHDAATLREAEAFPSIVDGENWPDRRDLRDLLIFTIDPEDARDFDDAISIEKLDGGEVRLGVHIADVSHYVTPGARLDDVAAERSTSVYLPGKVLPMLPERLSNDLCSLRPGEDRLTKSVLMTFAADGAEVRDVEIVKSVIHSRRRFSYAEVQAILHKLDGKSPSPERLPEDHGDYEDSLSVLARLRDRLTEKRRGRGALFLDLPKLRLEVGESGDVEGIGRDERDASHELIEEFMLAANEAVAHYLVDNALPLIGRSHLPPDEDRLESFRDLLGAVGFELRGGTEAGDFQKLVDEIVDSPVSSVIQLALLRTMPHAEYVAMAVLHFALATEAYCHFTSPIRRYPDLVVHQILDEHLAARSRSRALTKTRVGVWQKRVEEIAPSASRIERRAEGAERVMSQLGLIRYLRPRLGEEMGGSIVSLHPFGFVVRVEETLIEGIVHVGTLDAFFEYDPVDQVLREKRAREGGRGGRGSKGGKGRRGRRRSVRSENGGGARRPGEKRQEARSFGLGQQVRVELCGLDPAAREIHFRLV